MSGRSSKSEVQRVKIQVLTGTALQLDAQAIGNAIDKGIVGRYGAYVVDGPVVKPLRTQQVDVRFCHIAWRAGELNGIV